MIERCSDLPHPQWRVLMIMAHAAPDKSRVYSLGHERIALSLGYAYPSDDSPESVKTRRNSRKQAGTVIDALVSSGRLEVLQRARPASPSASQHYRVTL